MNQTNNPKTLLKNVLRINAIFSFCSGVLLIVFSGKLPEIMGFQSATVLYFMGPILCSFAFYVWIQAARQSESHVRMIIFQDILWVLASIILIMANPFALSALGLWLIAMVALIVLDFALLQIWGVRRIIRIKRI